MDAELRHAIAIRLDVDRLGALAPELYLGDVLDEQQLAAQHLGDFLELGCGVLVAVDGDKDAENVAIVVVDDGRAGAGRQPALHVIHLAAQLVPDLGQRRLVVLVLDADRDRRKAPVGLGLHLFQLTELLHRLLDAVADLLLHLFGGGAGVGRDDEGLLDGELGILES